MNQELTEKLIANHPRLMSRITWDNPQASLMCFGFEVNDGWFKLLDDLFTKLEASTTVDAELPILVQVKEKFGGLRCYVFGGTEATQDLINEAEDLSCVTCERCGTVGSIQNCSGWYTALCTGCMKE